MYQADNNEAGSSTLQLPLNQHPASRWQQLRQTLGAGSSTWPSQLRASAPGLGLPTAGQLPKQLRMSSSISKQDNAAGTPQPGLLQEAADVLRRCTGTGAALQAHETQLAAAALSSLGQYSSKDQFTIQANGSIRAAWADADQPLEQLLSSTGSAAFVPSGAADAPWASIRSSSCLHQPTASETAAAAAAFAATQPDSRPAADRSPPRRSPSRKQQQHQQHSAVKQQHQQASTPSIRAQLRNGGSAATGSVGLGRLMPAWSTAAAATDAATVSQGPSQQAAKLRRQQFGALLSSSNLISNSCSTTSSSRVGSRGTRPAAAAGLAVMSEHDKQLLQELTNDLAALLARKLLHRWQQHTADAKVDRARARPMQRLLGKRKALRAWKAAMAPQTPAPELATQPTAAAGPPADPNQQEPQQQQQLSRREQVAEQFHRLYRLHACLQQWRRCAAAGVVARRMQETDRIMAQQQAEMLKKQQEQEQQELQQQQRQHAHKRLAVAVRFHQMLLLQKSVVGWHKHAAIAAALSKLHPAVPSAANSRVGSSVVDSSTLVDAAAAMQLKAQQLLQRLAGKQQQTVPEPAPPAADATSVPSSTERVTSMEAERYQAQRTTQLPIVPQPQHQRQPDQLESCQPAAAVCSSDEIAAVQTVHAASQCSPANDAHETSESLLLLQPQQPAAAAAASQVEVQVGAAEHTTSHASGSCASVSRTVSCQLLQEVQALQPGPAAEAGAAAALAVTADFPLIAEAAAAVCDEAGADDVQQQYTQQVALQDALGSYADYPLPQLQALAEPQSMSAAQEQHEVRQQQQQMLPPEVSDAVLAQPAATEHKQQLHHHDSQQQQTSEALGRVTSSSKQQDTVAQEQQQLRLHRIGSIDKQQLQQKLRQLLAVEQRKQREEQRQEQLLSQQLAEQQEALAGMHYKLVLARRLGLQPWLALLKLRTELQQAAGSWRAARLARTAMLLWKELLLQRRARHTCCHIRAFSKLRQLRQRQQQQDAITALANWALASRQCRRQLVLRVMAAWRDKAAAAQQQLMEVQHAVDCRLQRRMLHAWRQHMEEQAQEQLLLELELNVVATKWRHRRTQQHVLCSWSRAAAVAVQEREEQARLQDTFSKVQGWLTEMKVGAHSSQTGAISAVASSANVYMVQGAAASPAVAAAVGGAVLKQLPPWRDWNHDSDTD